MQQPTCVPHSGEKVSVPTSKCVLRHSQEKTELLAMQPEMEMSLPTPDELNYDEQITGKVQTAGPHAAPKPSQAEEDPPSNMRPPNSAPNESADRDNLTQRPNYRVS